MFPRWQCGGPSICVVWYGVHTELGPSGECIGQCQCPPLRGQPLCVLLQASVGEWNAGAQMQHTGVFALLGACFCCQLAEYDEVPSYLSLGLCLAGLGLVACLIP